MPSRLTSNRKLFALRVPLAKGIESNQGKASLVAMATVGMDANLLLYDSRSSFLRSSTLYPSLATFRSRPCIVSWPVAPPADILRLPVESLETSRRETVKRRHFRIRKKLSGTTERPRLAVFRSNNHIYAQVIDDTKMHTLVSSSTLSKELRGELEISSGPTIDAAKMVGAKIAKACLEKGIKKVAFDRGGFTYHGRIQALADAARENGLEL